MSCFATLRQWARATDSAVAWQYLPGIQILLKQAAEKESGPWLRPLKPSLTAPGGSLIRMFPGHAGPVTAVAVTPDGRFAVSGSADATLRVWSGHRPTPSHAPGPYRPGHDLAVTPDGPFAISGSADATLRVWNWPPANPKPRSRAIPARSRPGRAPRRAVCDFRLRRTPRCAFNMATNQLQMTFQSHTGPVTAVAVTPDGRFAVSGSADATLRVWDLATGELQSALRDLGNTPLAARIRTTVPDLGASRPWPLHPDGRCAVCGFLPMASCAFGHWQPANSKPCSRSAILSWSPPWWLPSTGGFGFPAPRTPRCAFRIWRPTLQMMLQFDTGRVTAVGHPRRAIRGLWLRRRHIACLGPDN